MNNVTRIIGIVCIVVIMGSAAIVRHAKSPPMAYLGLFGVVLGVAVAMVLTLMVIV